ADHESLTVDHNVSTNNRDGIRWYEIRGLDGTPTVFQQGTFAPDATSRWIASVNMDHDGNIGVGYSVASSTVSAGISFAGRLATDPAGMLSQGETSLIEGGGGSQNIDGTMGNRNRWGDYASMSIDPSDDCTFWYTNEYVG